MICRAAWLMAWVAMSVSAPASAEWLRIGSSVDGSVWFMDLARIKTVSGKRQAWVKLTTQKTERLLGGRACVCSALIALRINTKCCRM